MKGVPTIIAVGEPFGRLTVTGPAFTETRETAAGVRWYRCYPCECTCGTKKVVPAYELVSGHVTSCGCAKREVLNRDRRTHGASGSPLYLVLRNMVARCENQANGDIYKSYGGRGINVCAEWRRDFAAFRDWALSHGYRKGLTIERKDVNGNYEPENCEFIPLGRQTLNKRNSRRAEYLGETKTWSEWSRDPRCAVRAGTFLDRLKQGWSFEQAFTLPKMKPHQLHSPRMCKV